jgi:[protein-PII] uridylyltransferase
MLRSLPGIMATLLQKIEASARVKLVLEPGRQPSQEIARYKSFLKLETHRLKIQHRAGAGGREISQARAHILDTLLQHFWDASKRSLSAQAQKEFPKMCLIALGGYGRCELNPHSDIDVMFLHNGQVIGQSRPHPYLARMLDGILYPLWDIGLKVGHAVRTLDDCIREANAEMQSKTSFIEARLVAGDPALFKKFEQTIMAKCVEGHVDEYISARMEDQTTRRSKYGNSACMQEPNIKNGCGGLRDFQNLIWITYFKYGSRSLETLQKREVLSATERKHLEAAYDFMLRVRTELHYQVTRPADALLKSLQPIVAHGLGYHERSPSRRIERFMRDLYTHMRNVFLITRTLEQRLSLVPKPVSRFSLRKLLPRAKPVAVEPIDGFKFIDGEIHAVSNRVFRDAPRRLMRVFLYAQQRGLRLHPDLAQLIRNQLSLVDRSFLADEHVHETFVAILNQRGDVARILRAMHEVDFLGKYIPEFGKLTCLVQHEFYHQYAADEHTLMCLEQLDRVWEVKAAPYEAYAPLLQELEHPYLLYLALLLHDVGKKDGHGNHAEVGSKLASRVARRLKLPDTDTEVLVQLVEKHLLMALISQRRDLDDSEEIHHFAAQVRNVETLKLLTLLTFVDSLATSDKLWNGFKEALLWSLHRRASQLLSGSTEFKRAEAKEREELMNTVREELSGECTPEEVAAHFHALPDRYFHAHTARDIVEDMELAHRFLERQMEEGAEGLAPAIRWRHQRDRGCTEVRVCTWDRAGLFGGIAGALSAVGLNILTAQIFTRSDGIVLDVFSVTDGKSGSLAEAEQMEKFDRLLTRFLKGEEVDLGGLIAKQKQARTLYEAYTGERIATQLTLNNEASTNRSLIEVESEDRIGLLHTLSQQFAELGINISAARICTEKGGAIDTFYVTGPDGNKIDATEFWAKIEEKVRQALDPLMAK